MNFVKIVFVVVVVTVVTLSNRADGEPLSSRCDPLKQTTLQRLCSGSYPMETKIKYHDEFVAIGEAFSIYQFANEPNRYFVSFKVGVLNSCDTVNVHDANNFTCKKGGGSRVVHTTGFVRCIAVHLHMVDELVRLCKNENGVSNYKVDPSVFVALHYHNVKLTLPMSLNSNIYRSSPALLSGLLLILAHVW